MFLKYGLFQGLLFVFKKLRYVFFITIHPLFPALFHVSLVLKSLLHLVPQSIRDILTNDTKKQEEKKKKKGKKITFLGVRNTTQLYSFDGTHIFTRALAFDVPKNCQIGMLIYFNKNM